MRHAWSQGWRTACALALALTLAAAPALAQESAKLDATEQVGQHLFNQSCRVCHAKPQLNSVQYGPVLSKASASGSARGMHDIIANGTPRMPGFRHHFHPEQIAAIVAYLMTVPPPADAAPAAAPKRSGAAAD